ncbi:type II toxin-antitoxin system PrlF family antitoxin [Gloeocapsa sp. PCC 73106]|uniref:type II toxin-antitoxin system PrlF family antitoxin n=1 Tax=Gloeocapsa sp. PCC 73106 TaxID=102232 RepID=UPI0002AC0CB7|nr:type II toxin-antitoxin system PrlF family antitoxin [Gloeocapsa sp. PCC 73106]ELR96452.1 regulator of stationary/sporulation gene expression [Gloeocapsa sp. PCC 73106]
MAVKLAPCSESTLTARYQTTIPEPIRKVLGLNKHDKICYTIDSEGRVIISRANQEESDDPLLGKFLNFLAQDIEKNPQHLKAVSPDLVSRAQSLVNEVDFDIDAPLFNEDE